MNNKSECSASDLHGRRISVNESVVRRVWVAAGGRCTICNTLVVENDMTGQPVFTGELAHIVGATAGSGSPRGNDPMGLPQRAEANNLMLLCGAEHKVIDSKPLWTTYSTDVLRAFKTQHESEIRELTALRHRPKSTVLRVVGDIRGDTVDFSRDSVVRAMLAQQLLPDFSMHAAGDDFEVDLRRQVGEKGNAQSYWDFAAQTLRERLAPLGKHIKDRKVEHLSVFALARIPLLVLLGTLLDDATRVTVVNKRRDVDSGWGWPGPGPSSNLTFTIDAVPGHGDPVVTFSLSGPVDLDAFPAELTGRPRYDLRATGVDLSPTVLRSVEDLECFTEAWRRLLARLEAERRNQPISVIAAVPAVAAVHIGRALMRGAHPPLRLFDRDPASNTYAFAIEVAQ